MSEGHDSELMEGRPLAVEVSLSEPSPETVHSPESPDGFVHVESSADVIEADLGGSGNQGLGSLCGDDDDPKVNEDMFVDCPDELVGNPDAKEAVSAVETEEDLVEKLNFRKENEALDGFAAGGEGEYLWTTLDKTSREKGNVSRQFEENRQVLFREISSLRQQLRDLSREGLLGEGQEDSSVSLSELVNECSLIVKSACESRLQSEAMIRELQATLLAKNQEVEELNARVAGFPVSDIEAVTNRLLAYYAGDQQEPFDDTICGKLVFVERGTYMLAERYNMMLYEIEQLRQCFSEANLDFGSQDLGTFFAAARGEVLELKRKELEFVEKLSHLENENKTLVQQLDEQRMAIESMNSELGKTKAELEQEKIRCSNTKEKLTIAVTKGKALVQQRDALKQSLAEKTGALEKCSAELQEMSNALQAAELRKDELLGNENLVASLQEELFQRNAALEKLEKMLSESGVPEELQSVDFVEKYRWLIDENSKLKGLSQEFHKVRDAFSLIQLPETVSSAELESQAHWVRESLNQTRSELNTMQDEFSASRDAAQREIDRLTASLSAELQTKDHLQTELDDLTDKYNEMHRIKHQLALEKDHTVKVLLEASEISMDDEEIRQHSFDTVTLVERCLEKIKERSRSSPGSFHVDTELVEKLQTLLYVTNQEMMLYELVLEEEISLRSRAFSLQDELRAVSQELEAVKEEKESLRKNLERAEEKSALVREKLSMAVKKGKGLVQDRESLKVQLEEKNSEIEKLRLQFQEQEAELSSRRDQITNLTADIERIPMLEMGLAEIKQQRDQLEGLLSESNNMLQRVVGSVDRIALPVDSVFVEPVEKLHWIASYINECQDAKEFVEKELVTVKEEVNTLSGKLAEAEAIIRSLEDTVSVAEEKISRLAEEKAELEIAKDNVEQQLQKAQEESSFHTGKFAEVSESRRSLEEALSLAENNIQAIISEKESALVSKAAAETELEQAREEAATQTTKLTEAYKTIESLEEAFSQVQTNLTLLTQQNDHAGNQRTELENELKKLQDEVESQASKLSDQDLTIKSLEDALLKAGNSVSLLEADKKHAEEEILTLNSKFNAYVEESARNNGGLGSRSAELSGYLYDLQVLMKGDTLLSSLKAFEMKFDSLRNADNILGDIRDHFAGLGLEELKRDHPVEDDLHAKKSIFDDLGNASTSGKDDDNDEFSAEDGDHVLSFAKAVERFQSRNKTLTEKFERCSTFIDEFIAAQLRNLQATKSEVVVVFDYIESLKQKVNSLQVYKDEQDNTISLLKEDITKLYSACASASQELQFDVENKLLELSFLPLQQLEHGFSKAIKEISGVSAEEGQLSAESSKYGEAADILLHLTRNVKSLCKHFESATVVAASTILDLQNDLNEARATYEKVLKESGVKEEKVLELEADAEALQSLCSELRLAVEDYKAKEDRFKEREAEVEELQSSLSELRILIKDYQAKELKLRESEAEVEALQKSCSELKLMVEDYKINDAELKKRGLEVDALKNTCSELRSTIVEYRVKEVTLMEREAEAEELKRLCSELRASIEEYQGKEVRLKEKEAEVEELERLCGELRATIEEYESKEVRLNEREAEVSSLHSSLLMKEREVEVSLLSSSQTKSLFDKIKEISIPMVESEEAGDSEPQSSIPVRKLFYIVDNFSDVQHRISSLSDEKEKLQSTLETQMLEIQLLRDEIENHVRDKEATETMKSELSEIVSNLDKIIGILGGDSLVGNKNTSGPRGSLSILEKQVMSLLLECESSKSKALDLGSKLVGSQKIVDELSTKVKLLEESLQASAARPEIIEERSLFEGPSLPTGPEISEIEDVGSIGKTAISPVPSAAQMRTMRKGSTDHLALEIDSESSRLISNEETDEDKGHVFKSLNTSGLVPRQGKMIADRVDGIWVSGGRILMSRPRARLGVIAYCLLLHIWLLATIV